MAAPIGNKFWQLRSKHGRDKLFGTPELMWQAACEYFDWCDNNPLYESKAFSFQGEITTTTLPLLRAYTWPGLCFYIHCNEAYFRTFKSQLTEKDKDFNTVLNDIEQVIYRQKFEGAACNLLNANIIARDLCLTERTDLTTGGDRVIPSITISNPEISETMKSILDKINANNKAV
jgi:hypothetical protein